MLLTDANPSDHAGRVERTHRRIGDLHRDAFRRLPTCLKRPWCGHEQGAAKQYRELASDANMAQAVGPIAGDFDLDGGVAANGRRGFVIEPRQREPLDKLLYRNGESDIFR